jgi:hypothetical protein
MRKFPVQKMPVEILGSHFHQSCMKTGFTRQPDTNMAL